jgi:hypothetical protein
MSGARANLILVVAALVVLTGAAAFAQEKPASPDPWSNYPAREAERPTLPAKGGWVMNVLINSVNANAAFDDNGARRDIHDRYNLLTADCRVHYGILERWDVAVGIPYLMGQVAKAHGGGMGDLYVGSRVALILTPAFELDLGFRVSIPTGDSDYQFRLINNSIALQGIRAGDPTFDYFPNLEVRLRTGPWAFRFLGEYVLAGPATIKFTDPTGDESNVILDPGDGYRLSAGFYYQIADHWVAGCFAYYENISQSLVNDTGLGDQRMSLTLQPQLMWQLSPTMDVEAGAGYQLAGKNVPATVPVMVRFVSRF